MKIQYAIIYFCSLLPLIKIKGGKKKKLKHFYVVFIKYVYYMCISIYVKEKKWAKRQDSSRNGGTSFKKVEKSNKITVYKVNFISVRK